MTDQHLQNRTRRVPRPPAGRELLLICISTGVAGFLLSLLLNNVFQLHGFVVPLVAVPAAVILVAGIRYAPYLAQFPGRTTTVQTESTTDNHQHH